MMAAQTETHPCDLIGLSVCSQLNFSEENYFENILENLAASAQKGHKKLREPVDPDMYETYININTV